MRGHHLTQIDHVVMDGFWHANHTNNRHELLHIMLFQIPIQLAVFQRDLIHRVHAQIIVESLPEIHVLRFMTESRDGREQWDFSAAVVSFFSEPLQFSEPVAIDAPGDVVSAV